MRERWRQYFNFIRPFTYSHSDTINNYSNYNQALAHPLNANVLEWVNMVRFQPKERWYVEGKLISWVQGTDVNGENFGNNILRSNNTRKRDIGYFVGDGLSRKGMNGSILVSFEAKENLFLELNILRRVLTLDQSTTVVSVGARLNMHRRQFDF